MTPTVLLINMPFGTLRMPSVGLSLLRAALLRAGISTEILYLTLPFADRIGISAYSDIANGYPGSNLLFGEWLFSRELFDSPVSEEAASVAYAEEFPGVLDVLGLDMPGFVARIHELRQQVAAFLETSAEQVLATGAKIIGFSSIFQQHVASLALARRIKQAAPDRFILLGGGNNEGSMGAETLRRFDVVDALVSGEADLIIEALVRRVLAGDPVSGIPGVYTAQTASDHPVNAPRVNDMDVLPVATYEDFFQQLGASSVGAKLRPVLPFELSRGCWWGEKMVCTFCGQNGADFKYRTKSAARAFAELKELSDTHPGVPLANVDNILAKGYFKDLIPAMITSGMDLNIYIPLKADLSREQVGLLGRAGVTMVLVGVESLSGHALKIMKKGISALQNIQFLKWCKEHSVFPFWNMLFGFPGETTEDYVELIHIARQLSHIPPPSNVSAIRVDRFSPNFMDPQGHGFGAITPHRSYSHVYPFEPDSLARLAYFFESEPLPGLEMPANVDDMIEAFMDWIEGGTDELFHVDDGARVLVWDARRGHDQGLVVLDGLRREIYLGCEQVQTATRLAERLGAAAPPVEVIQEELDALIARGLMLGEHRRALALSVEVGTYRPPAEHWERFLEAVDAAQGDASALRDRGAAGARSTRHNVWMSAQ